VNVELLDDLERVRALDPSGMLEHVGAMARQARDAWALTEGLDLPAQHRAARRVIVVGMGGSAIGGDLVAATTGRDAPVPILVHRDYGLPAYADEETLVIGSSYSGNTEETLSAFRAAHERGCALAAVSTDGKLAQLVDAWNVPLVRFGYPSQPRAALGYMFVALLGVVRAAGLAGDVEPGFKEALALLESQPDELGPGVPCAENRAKALAAELAGYLPVIVGAGPLEPVARRWKTQVNENSKGWSYFEALPEMDHNALSGIHFPKRAAELLRIVFLRPGGLHPRTALRIDLTRQIMAGEGATCMEVPVAGESTIAQILAGVQLGDYVSTYLALLYGADPTAIGAIEGLKERLAAR
jgi:glucose/mannose-6-phosphate isomerase